MDITPYNQQRGDASSNPARDTGFFFHFRDVCGNPFAVYLRFCFQCLQSLRKEKADIIAATDAAIMTP